MKVKHSEPVAGIHVRTIREGDCEEDGHVQMPCLSCTQVVGWAWAVLRPDGTREQGEAASRETAWAAAEKAAA